MNPSVAVLSVRLVAHDAELRRELEALTGPIAAQPGCRRCALLYEASEHDVVTLLEEWESRADLDRHLRSEDCRRLLALIERADRAPEVRIDCIAVREGMEAIARARGHRA
jgi:quinol monooxygenase YgiN